MSALRLALYQGPGRAGSKEAALAHLESLAQAAASKGAGMLLCPEMFLTGYAIGAEAVRVLAEPAAGPSAAAAAAIAGRYRLALCYGYPEAATGGVFNAAILIGPDGNRLANYRKTHLFGEVDRSQFSPGPDSFPIALLGGLKIGLLICYDAEFPETVRRLALAGADLVAVPTALMEPYDIVPDKVMPARAYESQVFLAYANRSGVEPPFTYIGHSLIAGPDGAVLAQGGREEEMLIADLDPALVVAARRREGLLSDRRPELYGPLLDPKPESKS